MKQKILQTVFAALVCAGANAQVNSGSNGSDGALNPTTNTVINMANHPNGIYQYTTVNIPTNVTVSFITNANNTPVTWLVQGNVVINGTVDISGQSGNGVMPGQGGPGGGAGGYGGQGSALIPKRGAGPGGGDAVYGQNGGPGSFATAAGYSPGRAASGLTYGSHYCLPLVGGSGGGGGYRYAGGGGGGGAIFIASNIGILANGAIYANGGNGANYGDYSFGGIGSGGAVRLLAPQIAGNGSLYASGGGAGFIRLDVLDYYEFFGFLNDYWTIGYNPVLVAPALNATLAIQSIAGNAVPANPTGVLFTPDATISAQQNNPIPIVVSCVNLPLNTPITVVVKPGNGAMVLGSTVNTAGTQAASTATVSIVMPRGVGLVYATTATTP